MSSITATTVAGRRATADTPREKRPHSSRRRRALILGCAGLLLVLALGANYGPLREWRDARTRLHERQAQVTALSRQKAQLDAQLKELQDPAYLEGLARQDLTYARPGEDVFIVSGLAGDTGGQASGQLGSTQAGASSSATATTQKPGLLERFLSAIGRLF
jgi:cell division protein FtsB